jgi:hypothetical protein
MRLFVYRTVKGRDTNITRKHNYNYFLHLFNYILPRLHMLYNAQITGHF